MSILVSLQQVSKTFGVRHLFEGLNFVIESNDRMGLIGPNGAGKSTLLKMIAQIESKDSGDISYQRGLRIGFLEQSPVLPLEKTVEEVIGENENSGEILSKLELNSIRNANVGTLSGGWHKRVALAKELVKQPDLLLLDEPTNHLDILSILWLEKFLAQSDYAVLMITHDRLFLQRVCNRILELDSKNPGGILNVKGDYATYLMRKEELIENQLKQETVLSNTLRRETEWLRQGAKARTTKQQARIHAAAELKQKVEDLNSRNQNKKIQIDFQSSEKKPKRLIEAQKISKSYGDKKIFSNVDLFLGPGDRIGLLGANGCGKSTLVKVLLGQEKEDSGRVLRTDHLKVAYFDQKREKLNPEITLRKALCPAGDHVNYRGSLVHIQGYIDRFLFRKEQIDMKVGKLSGGEQCRLLVAELMLKEANVLVLDEPTNDLDIQTLNVLQDCLLDFDGGILLVTHDRYFLDQVATEILAFPEMISYADLNQWENAQKQVKQPVKTEKIRAPQKAKKLGFNETRELQGIEEKIQKSEEKLKNLEAESQLPENISSSKKLSELYKAMAETQSEIETLYARWAELEAMK